MAELDTTTEPLPPAGNGVPAFDTPPPEQQGEQPDLMVRWQGQDVPVFLSRLTGEDHHHIRAVTGQSMADGLRSAGLDTIAAIVWRVLHRSNRNLTYQQVAQRVTLDDVS